VHFYHIKPWLHDIMIASTNAVIAVAAQRRLCVNSAA